LLGEIAQQETSGTSVGGLIITGLITGVISIVGSLVIARLTFDFVKKPELETAFKHELEQERHKRKLDRQERINTEITAWANPILVAVGDLLARLRNIIEDGGYGPLSRDWQPSERNWSITHDYFMNSTLYVFGRYFSSVQVLTEELGADVFPLQRKDPFFKSLYAVTEALGDFPRWYNLDKCPGGDTQVFSWQQQAMGEVLIGRDKENRRILTYAEFLNDWNSFSTHFEPLRALLLDIAKEPVNNCRWSRLEETRQALEGVQRECERLLALPVSSGE
jgi:hypothetical protein